MVNDSQTTDKFFFIAINQSNVSSQLKSKNSFSHPFSWLKSKKAF